MRGSSLNTSGLLVGEAPVSLRALRRQIHCSCQLHCLSHGLNKSVRTYSLSGVQVLPPVYLMKVLRPRARRQASMQSDEVGAVVQLQLLKRCRRCGPTDEQTSRLFPVNQDLRCTVGRLGTNVQLFLDGLRFSGTVSRLSTKQSMKFPNLR